MKISTKQLAALIRARQKGSQQSSKQQRALKNQKTSTLQKYIYLLRA